jgi:C-terminal processing protease CtpA/Prc
MRTLSLLSLILVSSAFAFAQTPTNRNRDTPSVTEMQYDFDLLQKAIEEVHGGVYRYATPSAVDRHFKSQREKVSACRDKYDFISVISETLAGLRDGHLRLEYDEQTSSELAVAKLFPFILSLEGEKAFVLFNDTRKDQKIVPGMELLSVNGTPIRTLVSQMAARISGDGFIETGKLFQIERRFATYYWLFIEQTSEFTLEARAATGSMIKLKLDGVNRNDRTINRTSNQVNADIIRNLPPSDRSNIDLTIQGTVATIWIGGFQGSDFKEQLDTVFAEIEEKKIKSVILDLRGNGGGVDEYGAYLVSQFTDQPVRYFDHIHLRSVNPSFTTWKSDTYEDLKAGTTPDPKGGYLVTSQLHKGVGMQTPGKNPFPGKLIVLLNGGTFSTAADVTATLHSMRRATFIGEESGGGYEGNTSGLNARMNLPHSGLSVRISLYDYWNAVTPRLKGRGTIPDHPLEDKVLEMLKGRDIQMDFARGLASAK